jgi:hypothetical protein
MSQILSLRGFLRHGGLQIAMDDRLFVRNTRERIAVRALVCNDGGRWPVDRRQPRLAELQDDSVGVAKVDAVAARRRNRVEAVVAEHSHALGEAAVLR